MKSKARSQRFSRDSLLHTNPEHSIQCLDLIYWSRQPLLLREKTGIGILSEGRENDTTIHLPYHTSTKIFIMKLVITNSTTICLFYSTFTITMSTLHRSPQQHKPVRTNLPIKKF